MLGLPAPLVEAPARAARPLPDFQNGARIDRQPWSNIRRATAEHLVTPGPRFRMSPSSTSRCRRARGIAQAVQGAGGQGRRQPHGHAMLVRVLATAVRKFPQFNASIDPERGEIVFKKYGTSAWRWTPTVASSFP